jgi:NAD(P)H-hydrate epimerase
MMSSPKTEPAYHNRLFGAKASRALDEASINEFGLSGFTLMELAATQAANYLKPSLRPESRLLICCGSGNNGGDALAVARLLAESGHEIHIYAPSGLEKLSGDAAHNLKLLRSLQENGTAGHIILSDTPEKPPQKPEDYFDAIIDGLFGTGLSRPVEGSYHDAITLINQLSAPVYALDIPSGLDADSGQVLGIAVQAHTCFMFGTRKRGCYLGYGPDYCGKRVFCPLPFPAYLADAQLIDDTDPWPVRLWEGDVETDIRISRKQKPNHKYENGNVYLAAGSPGLTGAAVLAAKAAWSTGCGSVAVFTPRELMPAYDAHFIEQTRMGVSSDGKGCFNEASADEIIAQLQRRPGVLVLGPGLGRGKQAAAFVGKLLSGLETPVILDADGFTALADPHVLDGINPRLPLLVTPHPGEQKRLHGRKARTPEDLMWFISAFPCHQQMLYLAKGFPIMMADERGGLVAGYDSRLFNRTGYGDVLSGLAGGFLSMMASQNESADLLSAAQKALHTGYSRLQNLLDAGRTPSATGIIEEGTA